MSKIDILIEEIRLLRAAIEGQKQRKVTRHHQQIDPQSSISIDDLSGLKGVMTAREVCLSIGVEYSKSATTRIGMLANQAGIHRFRTKQTRFFNFGNEESEEIRGLMELIKKNYQSIKEKKQIEDITSTLLNSTKNDDMVRVSKSLRALGFQQKPSTGEFLL